MLEGMPDVITAEEHAPFLPALLGPMTFVNDWWGSGDVANQVDTKFFFL